MKIKKFFQENASWVVLIILVAGFSIINPIFISKNNIITIFRQISVNGIAAVGLTIILISGGIDLSTGSQAAVSGILCASLMKAGWGFYSAFAVSVFGTSLVFGTINGLAVALTDMPALIATLSTMNIARGVAYLISNGYTIFGLPENAQYLGQGYVGAIPFCAVVLFVCLLIGWFLLNKTVYGRYIFAVGSNKEAARLSGIPVKLVRITAFIVGSFFMTLAGVVMMSRLNSGMPGMCESLYIEVLAGCTIGGISSNGGKGKILSMLGGIMVMGVISNGMNIINLSEYWQYVVKGLILIGAVGVDAYRTNMLNNIRSHTIRSSASAQK